jgi:hypothetical protein
VRENFEQRQDAKTAQTIFQEVSNSEQSEPLGDSIVEGALTWQSPEKADSPLGAVMG